MDQSSFFDLRPTLPRLFRFKPSTLIISCEVRFLDLRLVFLELLQQNKKKNMCTYWSFLIGMRMFAGCFFAGRAFAGGSMPGRAFAGQGYCREDYCRVSHKYTSSNFAIFKNIFWGFDETYGKPSRGPNEHLCQNGILISPKWHNSKLLHVDE